MKICALIPCYNHHQHLTEICTYLHRLKLSIIIVDDASQQATQQVLAQLARHEYIYLHRHQKNQGKGGAVKTALKLAKKMGYSHGVQIDADGQHCLNDIPLLLEKARLLPNKIISGKPVYDQSIPKSRRYGRYITHFWVWLETLSFSIKDSMCGFRVYPIASCNQLLASSELGDRMDFDIEILVRLYWRGIETEFVPTKVIYPIDGSSHFQPLADNVRISWLHTRLFFGMFLRMPKLLYRKIFR